MSSISFYIPVIADGIKEDFVAKVFKHKNIGIVDRVDFVLNKQKVRREAFVHFKEYFNNPDSMAIKTAITSAQQTSPPTPFKFYYKEGRFWALLLNKNPSTTQATRKETNVYDLEEQISAIKREMDKLTFMTKVHDANIRYILKKPINHDLTTDKTIQGDEDDEVAVKRSKTDEQMVSTM